MLPRPYIFVAFIVVIISFSQSFQYSNKYSPVKPFSFRKTALSVTTSPDRMPSVYGKSLDFETNVLIKNFEEKIYNSSLAAKASEFFGSENANFENAPELTRQLLRSYSDDSSIMGATLLGVFLGYFWTHGGLLTMSVCGLAGNSIAGRQDSIGAVGRIAGGLINSVFRDLPRGNLPNLKILLEQSSKPAEKLTGLFATESKSTVKVIEQSPSLQKVEASSAVTQATVSAAVQEMINALAQVTAEINAAESSSSSSLSTTSDEAAVIFGALEELARGDQFGVSPVSLITTESSNTFTPAVSEILSTQEVKQEISVDSVLEPITINKMTEARSMVPPAATQESISTVVQEMIDALAEITAKFTTTDSNPIASLTTSLTENMSSNTISNTDNAASSAISTLLNDVRVEAVVTESIPLMAMGASVEELSPATLSAVESVDEVSTTSMSVAEALVLNAQAITENALMTPLSESVVDNDSVEVSESSVSFASSVVEEPVLPASIASNSDDVSIFARSSGFTSTVEGISASLLSESSIAEEVPFVAPSITEDSVATSLVSETVETVESDSAVSASTMEAAVVEESVSNTVTASAATQIVESVRKPTISSSLTRTLQLSILIPMILKKLRWTLHNIFGTLKRFFPIIFNPKGLDTTVSALPMTTDVTVNVPLTQAQDLFVGQLIQTPSSVESTSTATASTAKTSSTTTVTAAAVPKVSIFNVLASLTQQLPLSRGAASIA